MALEYEAISTLADHRLAAGASLAEVSGGAKPGARSLGTKLRARHSAGIDIGRRYSNY